MNGCEDCDGCMNAKKKNLNRDFCGLDRRDES